MRFAWAPLLVSLVSCRAACGLDELEGAGGAGAGGGSTSTDASTSSAGGGGGAGGAGGGGEGGGCVPGEECVLCADDFLGTEPDSCLVVEEGCAQSGGGGGCAGTWAIGSDVMGISPEPQSGFWDLGWPAIFVRTTSPVPGTQPFIARTLVETLAGGGSGWPGYEFQLGGIVVSTTTDAEPADDWFKAEYGTLAAAASRGLRTVRHDENANGTALGTYPSDERIGDDVDDDATGPGSPNWVEIAVCRTDSGVLWAFYRPVGGGWSRVYPLENPALGEDAYVGLVAAAGSTNADLLARFGFFELRAIPSLPTPNDCETWLAAHPLPPAQ